MEQVSIYISIAALLLSIFTWYISEKGNKKKNETNLESIFYVEIFKDYLITELPKARRNIFIDSSGYMKEYDDLCKVLFNIKKKAAYFQYRNPNFYERLKNKLNLLEDLLVSTEGKSFKGREANYLLDNIDLKIEDIYSYILKSYFN